MLTKIDAAAMDAETVRMLSMIDEEKDANIIITAEGLIQFANKGVTNVCFQPPDTGCFAHSAHMELHYCNPSAYFAAIDSKCFG